MKHAGIHWPENAGGEHPNVETILGMPGILRGCTLICSPSARYWYRQARGASPLVVWRAVPRQGALPVNLGWNPRRVADECLNLWDEQPHGGTEWFLPLNELQFVKELGGLFPGYGETANHLRDLRQELRHRLPGVGLMFPAWVPSDDGDHLEDWVMEAKLWDALCLHTYGSAQTMLDRWLSYRRAFPETPIFVGEWNSNHEGHDEWESLDMWAEVADADPLFMGAAYYIWETNNAGERDLSIWGNPERLSIFQDPPVIPLPLPIPPPILEPLPEPEILMADHPLGIDVSNNNGAIDWSRVAGSGVQFAIAKITEGTYFRDGFFQEFWSGMKANGLYRGAYHFAKPSLSGPIDEANYFLHAFELLGTPLEPGNILALDLEDPDVSRGRDLSGWTLQWLRHVESLVGFKPLVYTSPGYAQEHHLANEPALADYGLWEASWGVPTPPQATPPWDLVAIHQYAVGAPGAIPGVSGEIDLNHFNGPIENLPKYGMPGLPTPVPAPDPNPPTDPKLAYLHDVVAPALRKELETCRASLGALEAAIETLERETT